jgi:hypothetical protein
MDNFYVTFRFDHEGGRVQAGWVTSGNTDTPEAFQALVQKVEKETNISKIEVVFAQPINA